MTTRSFDTTSRLPYKPQSSSERYSLPEDYLEIEVVNPITVNAGTKNQYTDYEIICRTNIPVFKKQSSTVRRRYSDFEWFRDLLEKENPRVSIPALPGKIFFKNRFAPEIIETRRRALERFLQVVSGHPLLQTGSAAKTLVAFIQDQSFSREAFS
ncbi:sorting nexin-3 [Rozella allomycis CSF55]|uniref:Sorting nexin-3 n=1 Tax=Rozella allomycis (strain CSF55) TaxID=988480 RepID=A0A075AQF0_ROZAC|nr:Sorting nexin-3 [Rozella allomycis CSF55]RKP19178.1 sorting nexin-3 [Rozella allomycis CSF55]|eukprot:EPZ32385.1 Sorting nexin-3 [Rozella allomycis CSF55]